MTPFLHPDALAVLRVLPQARWWRLCGMTAWDVAERLDWWTIWGREGSPDYSRATHALTGLVPTGYVRPYGHNRYGHDGEWVRTPAGRAYLDGLGEGGR